MQLRMIALLGALAFACGVSAAERNIVLFITDDQGPDAGCYGNAAIRMPNLDALAAEGMLFTHAFATTASCSASRSVVLSGLHNHRNGQYGHAHDFHKFATFENVQSLPVLLGRHGYRTARIGKFHVAPEAVYQFGEVLRGDGRNAVRMAEEVATFVSADSDRPFFLYFATTDPHRGGGRDEGSEHRPDLFGNKPAHGSHPGVDENEIQMYYPMRAVRDREFKLIWNIAHPLPFPFASDLWVAPTWQAQYRQGPDARYGRRSVGEYLRRPPFELFDLRVDLEESTNLAADPAHAATLERYKAKLRAMQEATADPWVMKWEYE